MIHLLFFLRKEDEEEWNETETGNLLLFFYYFSVLNKNLESQGRCIFYFFYIFKCQPIKKMIYSECLFWKKKKKGTTANEGLANVDASSFFFFALLGGRRGTMCLNLFYSFFFLFVFIKNIIFKFKLNRKKNFFYSESWFGKKEERDVQLRTAVTKNGRGFFLCADGGVCVLWFGVERCGRKLWNFLCSMFMWQRCVVFDRALF